MFANKKYREDISKNNSDHKKDRKQEEQRRLGDNLDDTFVLKNYEGCQKVTMKNRPGG